MNSYKNKVLKPAVSIVVPLYNDEKNIEKCLVALLNQNYEGKIEIIVVNDGSTDSSLTIVENLKSKYSADNLKIVNQKNQGPAHARNKGVKCATSNIILFTDSDCVPLKNWVEEMVKPFENDKTVAGVKGAYINTNPSSYAKFVQIEFENRYQYLKTFKYIKFIDTYSAGYKRDIFLNAGGFDITLKKPHVEDAEFAFRLNQKGYKFVFNENAKVIHLKHPDTLFRYVKIKFLRAYFRTIILKKYPQYIISDSYTPISLKLLLIIAGLLLSSILMFILGIVIGNNSLKKKCKKIIFFCFLLSVFINADFFSSIRKSSISFYIFSYFMLIIRAISQFSGVVTGIFLENIIDL